MSDAYLLLYLSSFMTAGECCRRQIDFRIKITAESVLLQRFIHDTVMLHQCIFGPLVWH